MVKPRAKWIGYIFLTLWVLLVFFLYLNLNWANVDYCLRTYAILPSHAQTLLLFLIPCLILASVATSIYLVKSFISKRT